MISSPLIVKAYMYRGKQPRLVDSAGKMFEITVIDREDLAKIEEALYARSERDRNFALWME